MAPFPLPLCRRIGPGYLESDFVAGNRPVKRMSGKLPADAKLTSMSLTKTSLAATNLTTTNLTSAKPTRLLSLRRMSLS